MVFDEYSKRRITELDNTALASIARQVAEASGASGIKANVLINNPDALRRLLASMSTSDVEKLFSGLTDEQKDEISRIVRGIGNG